MPTHGLHIDITGPPADPHGRISSPCCVECLASKKTRVHAWYRVHIGTHVLALCILHLKDLAEAATQADRAVTGRDKVEP
jgi:hypothetical protein